MPLSRRLGPLAPFRHCDSFLRELAELALNGDVVRRVLANAWLLGLIALFFPAAAFARQPGPTILIFHTDTDMPYQRAFDPSPENTFRAAGGSSLTVYTEALEDHRFPDQSTHSEYDATAPATLDVNDVIGEVLTLSRSRLEREQVAVVTNWTPTCRACARIACSFSRCC
jgi:hypothetical protein